MKEGREEGRKKKRKKRGGGYREGDRQGGGGREGGERVLALICPGFCFAALDRSEEGNDVGLKRFFPLSVSSINSCTSV